MRLSEKQKFFALEFIRLNSVYEAYLSAYNPDPDLPRHTIVRYAHSVAQNPKVKEMVDKIRQEQRVSVSELIEELADMVRFDPLELLDEQGNVKSLKDMPKPARRMIAAMDVNELFFGRGEDREQYGVVKKIKFIDKLTAIEKLMKHLGAYKEDNDQRRSVNQIAIFQLPDNERTGEKGRAKPRLIEIESKTVEGEPDDGTEVIDAIELMSNPVKPTEPVAITSAGSIPVEKKKKAPRKKYTQWVPRPKPETGKRGGKLK